MGKVLKIDLDSQREIKQEGGKNNLSTKINSSLAVGKIKTNFFLPDLKLDTLDAKNSDISPPVRRVVTRINKFIENIADDYFLLGLHLISLHSLLKESQLSTEQIKLWYAENINMPYSSAMQCRKVAEVYSDNPELIERYTASGAYLLSSCSTAEEREAIWKEAKGEKSTATVRDIREALKLARTSKLFAQAEKDQLKNNLDSKKLYSPNKIRKSLEEILVYSEDFLSSENAKDRDKKRKTLVNSVKRFFDYLEEMF
tara:strand:+ start:47 stop:817 length:771 start_codon:yes stop_codon:yes gene_type:complete